MPSQNRVKIQCLRSPAYLQFRPWVRCVQYSQVDDMRSFPQYLPFVFEEQVTQDDFDLIGGKKPAGASVRTVTKAEMMRTGTDQVGLLPFFWVLTHSEEAIAVKFIAVLVKGIVPHVSRANAEKRAFGDNHAVGQLKVFESNAVKKT